MYLKNTPQYRAGICVIDQRSDKKFERSRVGLGVFEGFS